MQCIIEGKEEPLNSANRILFGNRNADFDELLHNSKGSIDVIEHLKRHRFCVFQKKESYA